MTWFDHELFILERFQFFNTLMNNNKVYILAESELDDINFLPEFTANPEQCFTRSEVLLFVLKVHVILKNRF